MPVSPSDLPLPAVAEYSNEIMHAPAGSSFLSCCLVVLWLEPWARRLACLDFPQSGIWTC